MAERRPIFVTVGLREREEHEWVSRAGGLFVFKLVQVVVDNRPAERFAVLVTDLDLPEEA